jgi:hypothetical protein
MPQQDDYKADQETKAHDHDHAVKFLGSMRGRLIMSQALYYAIKQLDSVEGVQKEVSNIDDMKFLRDELFNFPVFDNGEAFDKDKKNAEV